MLVFVRMISAIEVVDVNNVFSVSGRYATHHL